MAGTHRKTPSARTPVQWAALLMGVVFLLVGVLGFVPGVTTDHDALKFAEHDSDAELLGVFQVSVLHNLVHLLFGIAGAAMAGTVSTARTFLVGGGHVYLALGIYGLVIDRDSTANFVPVNTADNWLHFALALGMIALGVLLPGPRAAGERDTR
ncbi:DUF4383 domain-containing protein [Streptomyces sp. NL15-2K]|uniref:DUF4383 domain-containing protein n=1 Tax=Streptomyces sp. NL15-2K TaxID=376149 RepID=UPI000F55D9B6|nr:MULTISPECIES: DUF4383 domain-containing protein [Actinomycetes]WKX13138.1 DUF4383 domain-containing protein [Kutzneria buriramensis]GCB45526.1 hypothetical protein SNL152K_2816 [Streptomyces sp. NL15-2K]